MATEVLSINSDISAVVLVGGLGTRLRSVLPSTPKPLAPFGGKTFLGLLIRQLQTQGIRRAILCTGFLAEQIETEFGDGKDWGLAIEYSREEEAMGTAGALKLSQFQLMQNTDFLVMNGDSFTEINFERLVRFHRRHGGLASMVVVPMNNAGRYGTVQISQDLRITGFSEKTGGNTHGFINAGIYAFSRAIFDYIPAGPASLEKEIFHRIIPRGMYAFKQDGMFIDIGIPEDYARAQVLSDRLCTFVSCKSSVEVNE